MHVCVMLFLVSLCPNKLWCRFPVDGGTEYGFPSMKDATFRKRLKMVIETLLLDVGPVLSCGAEERRVQPDRKDLVSRL